MAPNTFATKLSRNTNRITVILVYAFLEWLLMFFIFLNSLFTCFLVKFASFFGLKQICLLCPKLDRIFFHRNPENNRFTYRELLCPYHVAELASLGFCRTHGKLLLSESSSASLCSDCSDREERRDIGLGFCSCCEKSLGERHYPSYLLIKSSVWRKTLVDRENRGLILEMIDDDKIGDGFEIGRESDGFFREKEEEGKRGEQHQLNGEVISDVDSYGVSLREVSEEDGLRSIHSNHFLGNEDEIHEAEPRVPEDEQRERDDDIEEDVAIEGEDKTSVEETEREVLLDDQHGSNNNEAFVSENLSVEVDTLVTGIQNEEEEDQEEKTKEYPETPTSESSLLHKKLSFLSKNDYAAAEDARDVSIAVSDTDGEDPVRTIERLKETVRSEQEALRGLYAELEEERSASAIAANQTMAMITRLQEEKAKVQMEALQYQRMMEEQAEYDQEALQLLNHLMVKREKEKEELQRELDVCKAKVLQYEKNKTKCESDDDGDDDKKEEDHCSETDVDLEKITLDCVKHMGMLDESLSEFEEERLVILDQLKVLEDRLLTMQDKESAGEFSNSYEGESYEHEEGLTMASMAKSLLPLLDAAENESEDEYQEQQESVEKSVSSESEKLEIIKQVDSVYERLQVLETDGEFMKSCMSSAKNGDKGTDLLQDILQHLRDLRNIELTDTIENHTKHEE